jgi:hypothetical protein
MQSSHLKVCNHLFVVDVKLFELLYYWPSGNRYLRMIISALRGGGLALEYQHFNNI